ncbi:MAG: hypothetical protein IJ060_02980 [Oscillospiraceae bacterium]|nr:hypothetical protein [Oscillospiraceae bacterium]
MKQTLKKKAVILAAAAALLPCGIRASAAGTETANEQTAVCTKSFDCCNSGFALMTEEDGLYCTEMLCPSLTDCIPEEQGDLTDAEYAELKELYERLDAIMQEHADDDDFWEEDSPEIDALWERIDELEEKSGLYDDLGDDFDDDLKEALTEEEFSEYQQINARIDEIDELIFGDCGDEMTDEQIDAAYAKYEEELDQLYARLDALYEKAGFLIDCCDEEIDFDETDFDDSDLAIFEIDGETGEAVSVIGSGLMKNSIF